MKDLIVELEDVIYAFNGTTELNKTYIVNSLKVSIKVMPKVYERFVNATGSDVLNLYKQVASELSIETEINLRTSLTEEEIDIEGCRESIYTMQEILQILKYIAKHGEKG